MGAAMANRHYAQIGDVWKHLPLGEILVLEAPGRYIETHSGAATYPLEPTWEREYGALHYLAHCESAPHLRAARYTAILRDLAGPHRNAPRYPGSPALALSLLAQAAREFLFADLDEASLATIEAFARSLQIPDSRVRCVRADGIDAADRFLESLPERERRATLLFIDGYSPFEASAAGVSGLDLFRSAAERGARVVLWYGFHADSEPGHVGRARCHEGIREGMPFGASGDEAFPLGRPWSAEIRLEAMGRLDLDANPGVHGCGLLCANLLPATRGRCERLGEEMARIYHGARLPGDRSGAIRFDTIRF